MSPTIDQEYVQTNKVHWVYRVMAFLGQESNWAAEASYCADEQGKFWPYHDKLYENQSGEGGGAFSKDNLKRYASELGLNTSAFNSCLDSNKYVDQVRRDNDAAGQSGIRGTPTFLINGRTANVMTRDAQATIQNFRSLLDAELGK